MAKFHTNQKGFAARVVTSIVAISLIAFHAWKPEVLKNDAITIGLIIITILPWLIDVIEETQFPGGWKIKFRELEDETNALQKRIDHLFLSGLSPRLKAELVDFANNKGGPVELTDAYIRELSYLHNAGFIEFVNSCPGFEAMPTKVDDISSFLKISDLGGEYLKLAQELQSKTMAN